MTRLTAPLRKYPRDFEKVRFESLDGTRLVGWLGRSPRPGPRPGLVLLPGLFTSKDNNRIRARSVRIVREWGFNVLTLDLRGIGESQRVYCTPGFKEAEDIVAALRWFRVHVGPRPLHLYAESLAAAAALLACGLEGHAGRPLVDGRVLSVSPYSEAREIVERFSGPIDWRHREFAAVKAFFRLVLRMSSMGDRDFVPYVRSGAATYGRSYEEALEASSPVGVVSDCRSPTLVLHSQDDVIVPVEQAHRLRRAANGNPFVHVRILPWGNHCLYEMSEPEWYWRTLADYFGAVTS